MGAHKCLETYIIGKLTDGGESALNYFVNLISVAVSSVGVEGCLSRLLLDESLWRGSKREHSSLSDEQYYTV